LIPASLPRSNDLGESPISASVYAGTYTSGSSRGIYGYRFDPRSAKLKPIGLLAPVSNPTFLVAHPDNRFLYAVSQEAGGSVHAFLINPKTGKLSLVNKAPSKGDAPCHLALDRSGRWIAVANYGSGSVAVLPARSLRRKRLTSTLLPEPAYGTWLSTRTAVSYMPSMRRCHR
jgi:6-phosphogluconolactonase (cycloisomerase 2 family)